MMQASEEVLAWMDSAHARLSALLPQPQPTMFGDGLVFRYSNQTVPAALIQKLARVVTGLRAARLLASEGLFQEQGAMHRILDELGEDILFLCLGTVHGPLPPDHAEYLRCFYLEEWTDPGAPAASLIPRPMLSRDKIRAYISRKSGNLDPSGQVAHMRVIQKTYSGFVHAASPQIMDLYGGRPPHWHLRTMLGTPSEQDHKGDLWNVLYRGLCSFSIVAGMFDEEVHREASELVRRFAGAVGINYPPPSA